MLSLQSVSAGYGESIVLRNIDFTVGEGEVVALLGPNGAGKSTLLRTASGFLKPVSGQVVLEGQSVTGKAPHQFAQRGVCLLPEGRGIFPSLTVLENLRIQVGPRPYAEPVEEVCELFPPLRILLRRIAGSLSGGEQQMLALSRAFMTEPKVVLVDEASLGLAPLVIDTIYQSLALLPERGVSIVVVEQYVQRVIDFAKTVYILSRGEIVMVDDASRIDPTEIYERYLGVE